MVADGRCGARDISRTRGVLSLPFAVMGHIHVFDGAVDGRWARMLVGREIWYGARGLKKVSFLMESAGRAAVSLSGRVIVSVRLWCTYTVAPCKPPSTDF